MSESRKLAAILAADVVGYSRLTGADEDRTLARLRALRSDLIDPIIAVHRGRVVKRTGDGAIVEFRSVVDAVRCAIEVQNGMAERNAGVAADRRIEFRIGIHIGDVVEETDGDLMGDGVNIAARLEGVAAPGAICLSEDAYRQVRSRLDVLVSDLGETKLKNISEPVRVYSVEVGSLEKGRRVMGQGGAGPLSLASNTLELPDRPSIAVLPFQNMTEDAAQEHLADGVFEDVITALSRLRWLFVIARNSSFTYKGRSVDVKQVGRELGVRYVLEGSVRKSGNKVRINGQLIDTATGAHLWADRFDGSLEDIFELQDQITARVVGAISPQMQLAEIERAARKPPQNLDAWESFVRGMSLYSEHSNASTKEALTFLDRAIELDPRYGQAHGLRAVCLAWRNIQGWEERDAALRLAEEGANRAIECDAHEPWAYVAQGFVGASLRHDARTTEAFARAVEVSPNFAYAHGLLGAAHAFGGRPDQGIVCVDQGVRLSPRDIFGEEYQLYYSFAHFQAGRYTEAALAAARAIQLRPGHPVLYIMASASLGLAGELDRAAKMIRQLKGLVPNISANEVEQNFIYCQQEDNSRLAAGLRAAGLEG
jgi:adenylate cyclase